MTRSAQMKRQSQLTTERPAGAGPLLA
jgi:hypothetical protein